MQMRGLEPGDETPSAYNHDDEDSEGVCAGDYVAAATDDDDALAT